ncbi:FxDxF family PEP-CTERM protein [Methylophilus sp. 13]|uniref:FxDxF family PEP-CTERM protein n=1 Tax=Methylophilus sp. 13 TaxID=2781018 RepID=UPI00188E8BA1|nr:FxDxF family PEP-CTERM protein [Methylophilus sp. 13]MBF5037981.1 FxDxF family PEP-CTERM protein [Methylophilus sp. 13]
MLTRHLKTVLLAAVASTLSVSANAAVYGLNQSNIAPGSFSYTVNFSILSGNVGSLTGQVDSVFRSIGSTKAAGFDITDILLSTGSLIKADNEVITSLGSPRTKTTDSFSFSNNALAAGNYTLTVFGNSYSSNASFSGGFEVVTSPVPEAETTAMIGLGLGLMGLISRRKKQ